MKKIIISIATLGIIGVTVAGVTLAVFSDTETSSGNVFTAGTIDLTIDSNGSSYNGKDLGDTNFPARDLTDEHFFVFDDVKPGDYGVRDISMHVASNPAYACVLLNNKVDNDNGITDPEDESDGTNDGLDGTVDGDLSKELQLFIWEDLNNDQTYDPDSGETALMNNTGDTGPDSFFDVDYEIMFDSTYGAGALVQNDVRNIAIAWCAGTQTVDPTSGDIDCDGSGMGDISQSDTFSADLVLYTEQVRNNPDFECANVVLQ